MQATPKPIVYSYFNQSNLQHKHNDVELKNLIHRIKIKQQATKKVSTKVSAIDVDLYNHFFHHNVASKKYLTNIDLKFTNINYEDNSTISSIQYFNNNLANLKIVNLSFKTNCSISDNDLDRLGKLLASKDNIESFKITLCPYREITYIGIANLMKQIRKIRNLEILALYIPHVLGFDRKKALDNITKVMKNFRELKEFSVNLNAFTKMLLTFDEKNIDINSIKALFVQLNFLKLETLNLSFRENNLPSEALDALMQYADSSTLKK